MASNTGSRSRVDHILTGDENDSELDTNKSPGDKKKKKCEYRKGKKHSKYSVQDKTKVIELIESGTKTCDIVKMTGIPESTIRSIKKMKEEIKRDHSSAGRHWTTQRRRAGSSSSTHSKHSFSPNKG